MATKLGVTESESPDDKESAELPSGEGKNSSDADKRIENLKKEYERKRQEDKDALKAELQEELNAKIAELKANPDRTKAEDDKLESLQDMKTKIRNSKEAKPWLELISESSQAESSKIEQKIDYKNALDWVEDRADELGKDPKEFEKELVALFRSTGDWEGATLKKKCKMAFKEWKDASDRKTKDEETKKRDLQYAERSKNGSGDRKVDVNEALKKGNTRAVFDDIWNQQVVKK